MTFQDFKDMKGAYTKDYYNTLGATFMTLCDYCDGRQKEAFDCVAMVAQIIKNQWGGINSQIMDIAIELENLAFKRNVDFQMFDKSSTFTEMYDDLKRLGRRILRILESKMN